MASLYVRLTVARTPLPLGPRWGFTVLPHPGQPHATVMPGVEQSVRSVMPGVEPRGRRPRPWLLRRILQLVG